jgi:FdhD protein
MSEPATPPSLTSIRHVDVIRVNRQGSEAAADRAAAEEPLEVRLHDKSFAVIMRTPGDDRALTAGFLLAERIIRGADDIGAIEHCRHPDQSQAHHVVNVFLFGAAARDVDARLDDRRRVVANSSCGVCGSATIEAMQRDLAPLRAEWTVAPAVIDELPGALRSRQTDFDETGGLHAAGLFGRDGGCLRSFEDVGRHNAVDKVIGSMLLEGRLPLADTILMVSGRVSFEIVQKAWVAGISIVAAVSAPTSLAVELSDAAGITLLGFVRGSGFNIYAHAERISS